MLIAPMPLLLTACQDKACLYRGGATLSQGHWSLQLWLYIIVCADDYLDCLFCSEIASRSADGLSAAEGCLV